jgi:putative ABC transport system permease protein
VTRAGVIARLAWRETRASRRRLLLFASAISVGVAALVAIASFTANIQESVRQQARELLGGDLVLGSGRPFSPTVTALVDSLRGSGIRIARETRFSSMAYVRRTEGIRLADVRAVSPEFPIYGTVRTAPAGQWARLATERVAIVDTALLVALGARIGDSLELGDRSFLIAGVATEVPGRTSSFEGFGAQVFIPATEVGKTGLLSFGSRVRHTAYAGVPDERVARRIVYQHRSMLDREKVRAETAGDFQSEVTDALQNLSSFLQFVGLIALLLGGIGVASGVGAFVSGKLDTIAVLRCLGASRPLVFAIYLSQAAALGVAGAAAGALAGIGVQALLPRLLTSILPVDVHVTLEPSAILTGLGIGLAVAVLFALRPLLEVRLVSPLQALRRAYETEEGPAARDPLRLVAFGALVIGVFLIAMSRAEEPRVGVGFAVAIGLSVGLLTLAARGAVWLARRLSRLGGAAARWPYVVRQGLANLHRPRNQTRAVVTALGFGVTVLATLYLVQANLLKQVSLATMRAGGRANLVFIDIQPDQLQGVDSLVRAAGLPLVQQVAIVPMRVATLRGLTADSIFKLPRPQRPAPWTMRREYRSTYRDTANASETILQGTWWRGTPTGPPWPVSLSKEVAEDLKAHLGDSITWNVQGTLVPTRVAVIREVDWARFEPNFFAVFPTAALEHAPHSLVVLTRADDAGARARLQRAVAERFSNVTSYDVALLQQTIERIFSRVALAIRFMAVLSLATGTLVLLGAVAAGRLQRIREGALLKTLGATRRQLTRILLAEYLALGLLAGLMGIGLAIGGGWAMTHWVLKLSFTVPLLPLGIVLVVTAGLVALVGMAASREVFRRTAVEVLRDV